MVVSGDTGPLHIATAVGTPTVSLFGPTDPERNGPYAPGDITVSKYETCGCHYDRRCHEPSARCVLTRNFVARWIAASAPDGRPVSFSANIESPVA